MSQSRERKMKEAFEAKVREFEIMAQRSVEGNYERDR